jgi:hypothetical protein
MRTEAIVAYFKIVPEVVTLPPSVSRLSRENVRASTSHNSVSLHGLLQGQLHLFPFTSEVVIVERQ